MARLFTAASDEALIRMISDAQERLIVVGPGLSLSVAKALEARIRAKDCPSQISVTLDTDPEVCRLGYGDIAAIDTLGPALASKGRPLQTQPGLRIGLIVADSDILAYSPTPQLIEAGSTSEEKPNAIRINGAGPEELAFACGASDTTVLGLTQEVGLRPVTEQALAKAKADLEDNPPKRFDLVRLERVFNYKLEFVEFSVEGFQLKTRVVSLPPVILGLAEKALKDRLRNTFRVFEGGVPFTFTIQDPDDEAVSLEVNEKWFTDEARALRELYFISLGSNSYGNLIQKRNKAEFLSRVERLKQALEAYSLFVRKVMAAKIQETKDSLINSLLPKVQLAPPSAWKKHSLTGDPGPEFLRRMLEKEIDKAFAKADQTFSPKVTYLFKGVQYETITGDDEFRKRLIEEFGEEDTSKLLSEYEASRAEDLIPA